MDFYSYYKKVNRHYEVLDKKRLTSNQKEKYLIKDCTDFKSLLLHQFWPILHKLQYAILPQTS